MKVREFILKQIGMSNPRVTSIDSASAILRIFELFGVRVTRMDGTPFEWRFLRNDPAFLDIANEVIDRVMDTEVRDCT